MIEWELRVINDIEVIGVQNTASYQNLVLEIDSYMRLKEVSGQINCFITRHIPNNKRTDLVYFYKREKKSEKIEGEKERADSLTYLSKWLGDVVKIKKKELERIALGEDSANEQGALFPAESSEKLD